MSSDLEDLYREIILDHYRNPRNRGTLEAPPASRAEGFNPLCGDEVVVYLTLDDDGKITDIAIDGQGCSISQSSASMMSEAVRDHTVDEARKIISTFKTMMSLHSSEIGGDEAGSDPDDANLDLGDLEALRGVVKFPVRIKCATLGWNTLSQALSDASEQAPDPTTRPEGE